MQIRVNVEWKDSVASFYFEMDILFKATEKNPIIFMIALYNCVHESRYISSHPLHRSCFKWCQDYAYVKREYSSTVLKKNNVQLGIWKQGKGRYSIIVMWVIRIYVKQNRKQWKSYPLCQTKTLTFQTRFPKSWSAYRRQVVNPRHQTGSPM